MTAVRVQKLHTLTGHRDSVYTLEGSGSPEIFFSAGADGMVVRWDLREPAVGDLVAQLPNPVYALHYIKDKDVLAVGHNFDGIHLLDWRNKREIASLKLTDAAIFDIQTVGDHCYVACGDGSVVVVNMHSLSVVRRLQFSDKNARTIAVNPHCREVAVGYSDNQIRCVRYAADGSPEGEMPAEAWPAHLNSVFTLKYTPDYRYLLSGSRDARLKAWTVGDRHALHREIAAHLFAINHIAFSPDGKHFVTCSMDKSVKVWETSNLTLLKVIDKARHAGHGTSVNKLFWSSFNNQLVSASDDRTLSIWDVIF